MKVKENIKIGVLVLGMLFLGTAEMFSQQDPQYTQYMYNTSNINPAYTGSRGVLSIFGLYRTQWVGLDGAPKTANLSVESPISDSGLSLGLNYTNDRLGAMDENTFSINVSYTIDLNQDYKLAFGLKGTGNLLSMDYTKLSWYESSVMPDNVNNKFNPNIGAGLYMYSDKAYLGFSIPHFLNTDIGEDDGTKLLREKMHYYLIGGYVFDLNPSLKFKPAFLAKAVDGSPLQVDLTANFLIVDRFTVGGSYRWDASVSALAGVQVTDNVFIGYTYDADTSKLGRYNSGSHEIFLRFDLFNRYSKVTTSRFF